MSDHYEVLGVAPEADAEEIKRQYRFQLHAFHPDKFPASHKAQAEQRAKVINAAYEVLSDPTSRRDYDRQRGGSPSASPVPPCPPTPSSPPPGPVRPPEAKPPRQKGFTREGQRPTSPHFCRYELPDTDLLDVRNVGAHSPADPVSLRETQSRLRLELENFGVQATPGDITRGLFLTRYEFYLAPGVRGQDFEALDGDLARVMHQEHLRLRGLIPGRTSVAVDIPRAEWLPVTLRELLESQEWEETKAKIPLALGKDVYGKTIIADLATMPHCLVAGATGSGKSVCINSIVASLLYKFTPEQLRLVMVDPKVVELQVYNELPHLVVPVVTDPKKVLLALRWVIDEMMKRYELFARTGVRNVTGFNARQAPATGGEAGSLPGLVVFISDLDCLLPWAEAAVEGALEEIVARGPAAGVYLVVSSRLPHLGAAREALGAALSGRVCLRVPTAEESLALIGEAGAERMSAPGEALLQPGRGAAPVHLQGAHVSPEETLRLVQHAAVQGTSVFDDLIQEMIRSASAPLGEVTDEEEELVEKCLEIMRQEKKASTPLLQLRLRLGYTRAARIVDILEARGIVGPENASRGREILVDLDGPAPTGRRSPSSAPPPGPLTPPSPGFAGFGSVDARLEAEERRLFAERCKLEAQLAARRGHPYTPPSPPPPRASFPTLTPRSRLPGRLLTGVLTLAGATLALRAAVATVAVIFSRPPSTDDLNAMMLYGIPAVPPLVWSRRRRER